MSLRATTVSFAYLRRTGNSHDVGFSAKVGTGVIWCIGKNIGSVENCLNVTIVSSFESPTLWVFSTRARPLEVQLQPRQFPKAKPEGEDAQKK